MARRFEQNRTEQTEIILDQICCYTGNSVFQMEIDDMEMNSIIFFK